VSRNNGQNGVGPLRRFGAALSLALLAGVCLTSAASATAVTPPGYFDAVPDTGGEAEVEADLLTYDSAKDQVTATGNAVVYYQGYRISSDQMIYDRPTGRMFAVGNVFVVAPDGNQYWMDQVEVTGGVKQAFVRSMTLRTPEGELIYAQDADYASELRTILTSATYSPCGDCIDEKGNRIGWKIYAARLIRDEKANVVYLEQPTLEVLGLPVAWFPWLALPDPTKRASGFRMPRYDYSQARGFRLETPFFVPIGDDIDLLLMPSAMTRQGFLMGAEWEQRFTYGSLGVRAAGIYQLDPSAFTTGVGDRDWRAMATAHGQFVPLDHWTVGFSASAFTDAGFYEDYGLSQDYADVNEVYATYLTDDVFADFRLQKFNKLGADVTWNEQVEQIWALPNIKAASYVDLAEWGQLRGSTRIQGIIRGADDTDSFGGKNYVFGYEENKAHVAVEGSWQQQVVTSPGVVVTPYLGLRGDIASYDGASALNPTSEVLFALTPIAAVDVRYPMVATNGGDSYVVEPIGQLVYRGSDETTPGITNDNAQSFVFDDTNLFSYDRFSGSDRQETGLRANLGARFMANFQSGQWLEVMGGQSYHLDGVNSLDVADAAQTGASTGLGDAASYLVFGAQGSPLDGVVVGGKLQVDPDALEVTRAGAGATASYEQLTLGFDYFYLAADTETGTLDDQHEVTVRASAPLPMFDYWTLDGSFSWDLDTTQFLQAKAGITYDDGYLLAGTYAAVTGPTHSSPNDLSYGFRLLFKGPTGSFAPLNY